MSVTKEAQAATEWLFESVNPHHEPRSTNEVVAIYERCLMMIATEIGRLHEEHIRQWALESSGRSVPALDAPTAQEATPE